MLYNKGEKLFALSYGRRLHSHKTLLFGASPAGHKSAQIFLFLNNFYFHDYRRKYFFEKFNHT